MKYKTLSLILFTGLGLIILANLSNADSPPDCSGGPGTATYTNAWRMYGPWPSETAITINSGSNNTLCSIFYDINNRSLIDYNASTDTYTLNNITALAILPESSTIGSTLYINNTNLIFGNNNGGRIRIRNEGNLYINNSNITSLNASIPGYIWTHQNIVGYGERPRYNLVIKNSKITYLGANEPEIAQIGGGRRALLSYLTRIKAQIQEAQLYPITYLDIINGQSAPGKILRS